MESLTSLLYTRSLDDAGTESDSKLGFARLGHEHSLRIAHPDPPDTIRLRAAHAINFAASLARPHPRHPRRPRGRDQLDDGDGVARGGRLHGVGLGSLRACGASVTLRSRDELEISKSVPGGPKPNVLW